jgi:ribosomal protein L11 methyltransferase
MSASWILTLPCNRAEAEALTGDHPALAALEPAPVLVASEEDEDADIWRIDAYFEGKPPKSAVQTIGRLLGISSSSLPKPEKLPDADWVTLSQQGLEPVRAGRFYVHTANDAPDDAPGLVNFCIDAGQAFGTGHHATTAGCLSAIDALKRQGRRFGNIADIGTGTGLLAFAAMHLWPRAFAIASDIDPVSVRVTIENAAANGVPLGTGAGQLMVVVADGTRHPLIMGAAPYDLVIANILAGPLIALAPALAAITAPGGTLVLAGLLAGQRDAVRRAYARAGFRLDRTGEGEWSVLVLSRRQRHGWRRPVRSDGSAGQMPGDFGSW